LVQACGTGLVPIILDEDKIFFTLPEAQITSIDHEDIKELADALGVSSDNVQNQSFLKTIKSSISLFLYQAIQNNITVVHLSSQNE
jgi:predicted PhzF superfamily epimerase YddE/YHI9